MPTTNYNLPTISDNMANDVVKDMNALASATDSAIKLVDSSLNNLQTQFTSHLTQPGTAELYYRNEVNQTIPNSFGVDCVFTHKGHMGNTINNTEIYSDGRIKVNKGGLYLYAAKALYLGNPDGTRSLTMTRNGAGLSANVVRASDADVVDVAITQLIQLDPGDIIGMSFYQNSGKSLDIFGGTTQTFLQLYLLGGGV